MPTPFNPLDRDNLADSISRALLNQPTQCLDKIPSFSGAGVYALYYRGKFGPYQGILERDKDGEERPIYIGKAVPKGGRMGGVEDKSIGSDALVKRIRKHAAKINAAKHLKAKNFHYRYLVTSDAFIGLCEIYLIGKKLPLWNTAITGFGNNALGSGRSNQRPSLWDVLHPPRTVSPKVLKKGVPLADVLRKVDSYFAGLIPEPLVDEDDEQPTD